MKIFPEETIKATWLDILFLDEEPASGHSLHWAQMEATSSQSHPWRACLLITCSVTQSCPTLCDPRDYSTSGFPVLHHFPDLHKLKSIESVMPSNHLILCLPLSSHLQSFPRSGSFPTSQFFTSGGQSIGSFRFSISPSNEYSGLISFRIDWFDLLAVQGTLKSLLQHHSLKASVLWCSTFFMVQLSHLYMTAALWLEDAE